MSAFSQRCVTTIRVRYAETDAMAVAHHASYLPWFEVGRTDLIRAMGYPYKEMEEDGVLLPVIEVQANYVRSVHYDDVLELHSFPLEQSGSRLKIGYEIYRNKILMAKGHTIHAFTDKQGKPIRPPKKFLEKLAGK